MKNKIALLSILSLMFILVMSSCGKKEEPKTEPAKDTTVTQQTDQQTPPEEVVPEGWTKLETPVSGKVACFTHLAFDSKAKFTLDEAKRCASKGNPVGLLVGDVFYFVFNQDGSAADKMLAEHADKERVEITGYTKIVGTMYFLMAKEIKPGAVATIE